MSFNPDEYQDRPLFLTDLQASIERLPAEARQAVVLHHVVDAQGRHRLLRFEVPRGPLLEQQAELWQRYVLAMVNNMIVSFGGVSLTIHLDTADRVLLDLCERAIAAFDLGAERNCRSGCGVYINYTNRMNRFLGLGRFSMRCADIRTFTEPDPARTFRLYEPGDEAAELSLLRRSATELDGKCLCSLDVGGNSIKAAVVSNGEILLVKEHKWYPTGCRCADEMNGPQLLLIRFLGLMTRLLRSGAPIMEFEGAMSPTACCEALEAACAALEARGFYAEGTFDALVIGFPDIVVGNKIAGGESFKHLGMKTNPDVDYEEEFAKTSCLDDLARRYVREGGPVIVLNDGNAASYVTSVEQAFLPGGGVICEHGMFANTIGTEMGTGFISRAGTIQNVPLEGFQHIIDLGSLRAASYPAVDVRSINSMNTALPGTVQKYISQLGLFRMAITELIKTDPQFVEGLISDGLLIRAADGALRVAVSPIDQRGRLTHLLIGLIDQGNPAVSNAFRTMGKALGVLIDLDRAIFPEIACTRLLSGGIVSSDKAFALILRGLKQHNPAYEALRLDEETMTSPLLRRMKKEQRSFNVAIASAYIGNRFLIEAGGQEKQK